MIVQQKSAENCAEEIIDFWDSNKLNVFSQYIDNSKAFTDCCDRIKASTSAKKVFIGPFLLHMLSEEKRKIFYDAICSVENLEELYIAFYSSHNMFTNNATANIPPALKIAPALARTYNNLTKLHINCASLVDNDNIDDSSSTQKFEDSIRGLKLLKSFEWVGMAEDTNLDAIVNALSELPELESVCLGPPFETDDELNHGYENGNHHKKNHAYLSPETAYLLSTSKTLKSLKLHDLGFDDEHIQWFEFAFRTNDTLKSLHIDGRNNRFSDYGAVSLADCLRSRYSVLEHVEFSFNKLSDYGIIELSDSLKVNRTVKSILIKPIFFEVASFTITRLGYDKIVNMLENYNFILENFRIMEHNEVSKEYSTRIDLYLKLNRAKRRSYLKRDVSFKESIKILNNNQNDLSCLYYLIRVCPDLCVS